MGWHAKPSGSYLLNSQEAEDNVNAYYNYFKSYTTLNNIVGMLCNINNESGLNPWRWQNDVVNTSAGYGLYQYTEASSYIALTGVPGHAPNMSTTQVLGGNISDAEAQMYVFINDLLGKWKKSCWRIYWDPNDYPALYAKRTYILNTYGDSNELTMAQFFTIDNQEDACFAFLACFEGPGTPNLADRMAYAQTIENLIHVTPPPTPPSPTIIRYGGVREILRKYIIHA